MHRPWDILREQDEAIFNLVESELLRQQQGLELIASENFTSPAVMAAMGTPLTNKYAEGLPGKRYYGGCVEVDKLEQIAIDRAKGLFGASYVNVQPHSGAQANAAAFLALCNPGDVILGMDLSHGGHLTHGAKVNFSGTLYQSHFYRLNDDTERLDYDAIAAQAQELKPKLIIAGASAYARQIDFKRFREIADSVGAYLLVDMAHIAGLVAADLHPSPIPHAHVTTTTTHKTLRGPRGGLILWNDKDININKAVFPGIQGGPLEHVIAAKAICFKEAATPEFAEYQKAVVSNAATLGSELVRHGFKLVSGGSDNHLVLMDLSGTDVSGKDLEEALGKVDITVNKNTVPKEQRSPFVTSGVRLGTPALTSRGMREKEMVQIAGLIRGTFENIANHDALAGIRDQVLAVAKRFPLYPEWSRS